MILAKVQSDKDDLLISEPYVEVDEATLGKELLSSSLATNVLYAKIAKESKRNI
jgi:hypothetical protein